MPLYDYECPTCKERVEDSWYTGLDGQECGRCGGTLRRVYSFYIAPVKGAGGSPGHAVRGNQ